MRRPLPAVQLFARRRYFVVVPMPMFATPRSYLIVVRRPLPAAPLVERRWYFIVVSMPMPAAPRRYLIVVPRSMPSAPRRYLIVMPRPQPAASPVLHHRYLAVAQAAARGAARCASQVLGRGV